MKTLKIIFSVFLVALILFFVSCDVIETTKKEDNIKTTTDLVGYNCPNPNSCTMVHLCLYLRFNDVEFDYENIYKALVVHEGHDCISATYYCSYVTSGSNPTGMGCYLPWNDYDCHYIRSVCLTTYGGDTYTGSVEFSYPLSEQIWVDLYYNPNVECNFGGIEKSNE